ncbi:MAG TPA: pyrroline-5-carboxylate reductase [Flavobacteriales bacterium]|nr:pyrroline-5-carboxylate reductase [Crocinitomicaceae bacterium]HAE29638.1 pyrroline-5-carboxylate reductase [Flavobacteriales bacterium]|tara:strand:- start:878 stop:1708 length:831 start_codon:yes stop_codon:yes gene_type:complete
MSNNELKPAKVAIIGGGNIGVALARGLVNSGDYCASEVIVTRRRESKLNFLKPEGFQVTDNNTIAVANAPTLVLAVLPQQINTVLDEINDGLTDRHLIVSVVSGVSTQNLLDRICKPVHLVRAMPNTAISIGESMTCIAAHKNSQDKIEETRKLFDTVGLTMVINESQMTSATALCACGVAFFLRAIRAASQGGTEIEFHSSEALKMAAQTAKGAAALLLSNDSHPEDEIDKVTSPKGCTIAGLNQMEHNGFSSAFIKGITTSAIKAGGLYDHEEA